MDVGDPGTVEAMVEGGMRVGLDIEGLISAIRISAEEIGQLASGDATREAIAEIPGTLAEVRETLRSIQVLAASADTTMSAVRTHMDATAAEAQNAAEELSKTLENLQAVLDPGSPLLMKLEESLNEISLAAAAVAEPVELSIGIGPVTLPAYLKRTRMVTRRADNELHFLETERWAEPPGRSP